MTDMRAVHEDPLDHKTQLSELENENKILRRRLETLERERQCRSPTKSPKKPKIPSLNLTDVRLAAGDADRNDSFGTAVSKLNTLTLNGPTESKSPAKTPGKKIRKLTARKWDLMDENEIDAFENY